MHFGGPGGAGRAWRVQMDVKAEGLVEFFFCLGFRVEFFLAPRSRLETMLRQGVTKNKGCWLVLGLGLG